VKTIQALISLLSRFLSGSATPRDQEVIEKWYSALDSQNNYPTLDEKEAELLHRKNFEKIRSRIKKREDRIFPFWLSLGTAATLLFGIGCIYMLMTRKEANPEPVTVLEARTILRPSDNFYNRSTRAHVIWLVDSSRIELQPGSSIAVDNKFNQHERNVRLEGEALFEIKRNEHQPFHVFAYDIVTSVLGTSFVVSAPSKTARITVSVKTGKVSVMNKSKDPKTRRTDVEVILTPNQQVTFDPTSELMKHSLVAKPIMVVKPAKVREEYDEEPIINILAAIEKQYGMKIRYDAATLQHCKISTTFEKEDLFQRLEILTQAIGGSYSIQGIEISIQSKGCRIK
jgi:transmembrane sensor